MTVCCLFIVVVLVEARWVSVSVEREGRGGREGAGKGALVPQYPF